MGFCPYFLQEKSSGGISDNLLLMAGTLNDLFILSFLHIRKDRPKRKKRKQPHQIREPLYQEFVVKDKYTNKHVLKENFQAKTQFQQK